MGWIAFRRRLNNKLRGMFSKMGISELTVRLLGKQHAWAGHVSRLDAEHLAGIWSRVSSSQEWLITQAAMTTMDQRNTHRWRHPRRGRLPVTWETWLVRTLGDNWRFLALQRDAWRSSREDFVKKTLTHIFGVEHNAFGS